MLLDQVVGRAVPLNASTIPGDAGVSMTSPLPNLTAVQPSIVPARKSIVVSSVDVTRPLSAALYLKVSMPLKFAAGV